MEAEEKHPNEPAPGSRSAVTYVDDINAYLFDCPHCGGLVQVTKSDVRCAIFRHAVYRRTGRQVRPHAPKEQCEKLFASGQVEGCAKPFRLIQGPSKKIEFAEKCDYI